MRKKILGKDLKVSAVGLGCMGMNHAYGASADKTEMINQFLPFFFSSCLLIDRC